MPNALTELTYTQGPDGWACTYSVKMKNEPGYAVLWAVRRGVGATRLAAWDNYMTNLQRAQILSLQQSEQNPTAEVRHAAYEDSIRLQELMTQAGWKG